MITYRIIATGFSPEEKLTLWQKQGTPKGMGILKFPAILEEDESDPTQYMVRMKHERHLGRLGNF